MNYRNFVILPTVLSSSCKRSLSTKNKRQNLKTLETSVRLSQTSTAAKIQAEVQMASLKGKVDRHNGVTVNIGDLATDTSEQNFQVMLKDSLKYWESNGTTCVWLYVPIMHSRFIPLAAEYGFTFHHGEHNVSMLYKWLDQSREDKVPPFATHQIGSAGCVISDEGELLMVQDRHAKIKHWKFPGGLCELGEDIGETAEREVYEETGIKSEFQSILAFRQNHDHPGAFGRSDIYVICRMKPLTFDLNPCPDEILKCEWKSLDKALQEQNIGPITAQVLQLVRQGLEEGWENVDLSRHDVTTVRPHKKQPFLYHRPLARQVQEDSKQDKPS